jgi:hypothetical protein
LSSIHYCTITVLRSEAQEKKKAVQKKRNIKLNWSSTMSGETAGGYGMVLPCEMELTWEVRRA